MMDAQNNAANKSEFIRQQPSDMSVAEVVEKARAEGLSIGAGLVYGVRRRARAKKGGRRAGANRAFAGPSTTAAAKANQAKADFVRAHSQLSATEIAAKANEEGVALETGYVYNVRTSDKRSRKKSAATPRSVAGPQAKSAAKPGTSASDDLETLLVAVAAEVGLGRAIAVLEGERARVRALIKG
ncbi:MAG: hypothetical protein ABTD50_02590 [Polyangiaceae bacterium]